jgi:ABC-type Fe3+-hydroxamate transport system substrate-binding protein
MNPIPIKDQMGRQILLPPSINKIVSLVPSQTELLFDLGLEDRIVGVTKFCVHPPALHKSKTIVGGTKQVRMDVIDALQPDLIIGNKEENNQDIILQLEQRYPVWMSDVNTLEDAYAMIFNLGSLFGKRNPASALIKGIQQDFAQLEMPDKPLKVAYFIWREPYMVATSDTFINEMIHLAGFENIFRNKIRYPEVTLAELSSLEPDLIFLSSEPFPFKLAHFPAFQSACPRAKVVLVDGEYFSWYGSRLRLAGSYFKALQKRLTRT